MVVDRGGIRTGLIAATSIATLLGAMGVWLGIFEAGLLTLLFAAGATGGFDLLRKGRVELAAWHFVVGWFACAMLGSMWFGGIDGPAFATFFPACVVAAGLVGPRGLYVGVAMAFAGALLGSGAELGLIPVKSIDVPQWVAALGVGVNLGLAMFMLGDADRFLSARLTRAASRRDRDPETGLPDKIGLLRHLSELGDTPPHLLAVRFDGLRRARQTLGPTLSVAASDQIVARFRSTLHSRDLLARTGDSTFAVALGARVTDPGAIADRLLVALRRPLQLPDGTELMLPVRVGLMKAVGGNSPDSIVAGAELALGSAKVSDKQTEFRDHMRHEARRSLELDAALHRALLQDELEAWFQPIVDLRTELVLGLEALVRWRRASGELVAPDEFIPRAEESGLVDQIDRRMMAEACRALATWRARIPGTHDMYVSVNVSPVLMGADDLVPFVTRTLADAGIEPTVLRLEMTERTVVEDAEAIEANVSALHDLGVAIVIDDFGTGYSSLAYLSRVDIDAIKLDREFVDRIVDERSRRLAGSILGMAESLGLATVAEGVENREQALTLQSLGYGAAQGYLYARPMPPDKIEELLRGPRQQNLRRATGKYVIPARVLQEKRTRIAQVMQRNDGLLHYVYDPGVTVSVEDAREIVAALREFSAEPPATLIEMQRVRRMEPESRRLFEAGVANSVVKSCVALVVGTPVSRVIATAFLGLNQPNFAIAVFEDVREAEAWLHRFGKATLASSASSS